MFGISIIRRAVAATALAFCATTIPAMAGQTLDAVKARGQLVCGIHTGIAGFAVPDSQGVWKGLEVDLCRGLAAALFNDASKVRFQPLTSSTRFAALSSGEIDVMFRLGSITTLRDTDLGLRAVTPYFYDGHAFIVRGDTGVKSVDELAGATICLVTGSTNELITADYFRSKNLQFTPLLFERQDQVIAAMQSNRCDSYGTDAAQLVAIRSALPNPADWTILPERFSKEPLAPYVRRGDEEWFSLVRWYINALVQAEEDNVTSQNVEELSKTATSPDLRRLLGVTPELGNALKVDPQWVVNVVKAVGNYGEIYDRSFGENTPIALKRGLNDLWSRGGLLYAYPMR